VETPFGRIASVICFDLDFPSLLRQAGQARVDLMFVPANDWKAVAALHQHQATFRAIEQGFALVRATSNGISVASDSHGRVVGMTNSFATGDGVLVAQVPVQGVPTIYARIGDLFAWGCVLGCVAFMAWTGVVRRGMGVRQRQRAVQSSPGGAA